MTSLWGYVVLKISMVIKIGAGFKSAMLKRGVLLVLFILLGGCESARHDQLADLGFTRPYLDGYQDGCHSRKEQAVTYHDGFRQDPERMLGDRKYANGWQDGYEQCYANHRDYH
ncbi:hypothetical protein [Photobacterium swingsii]|uniref:hypothetical protein n=1 Tax=Photobacterium swingsii TaxID=680026 RepID=UPI004069784F